MGKLWLTINAAEQWVYIMLGRHRQAEVLKITQTEDGRNSIAKALEDLYAGNSWWDKGIPTIKEVFKKEKPDYVSGLRTSLPWCTRDGKP